MNSIITLEDFPKERTFIRLKKDINKKLLRKAIKKAGSQRLLANRIKYYLKYPKIKQSIISNLLKRDFHRLDLMLWLNNYTNANINIKKQIEWIKGESTSRPLSPIFPIKMSESLAIVLANIYCDGSANDKDGSTTKYYNQNKNLLDNFKHNLTTAFGNLEISEFYSKETKVTTLNIPHFIGRLLYTKFRLNNNKIPKGIMNSDDSIKGAYLRAVFDDEGTIAKKYGQIRLKMKYKSYVGDVKSLLNSLSIETSKLYREKLEYNKYGSRCYYFTINGQYNIRLFLEKVGFNHEKKLSRLKSAINNISLKTYGYKSSQMVLDVIKKAGPKTAQEIAGILDRDKRTIQHHLRNLFKNKLVSFKKVWKKYAYEYLWFIENGKYTYNS